MAKWLYVRLNQHTDHQFNRHYYYFSPQIVWSDILNFKTLPFMRHFHKHRISTKAFRLFLKKVKMI